MVGLTSEVAYLRLVNDVRNVLDTEKHVSRRPLSFNEKVDFGMGTSVLIALVVAASYYKNMQIVVEFLILFPALVLLAYTTYRQRCHSSIFAQEKVKEVLERFEEADEHREESVQAQGVPLAATSTMVSILRDGKWSPFPANIIVEGDLFRLHPGASMPIESKGVRISGYECVPTGDEFAAGEMWDPANDLAGHFLAKHTVAALQVKKFLRFNLTGEQTRSVGGSASLGIKPLPRLTMSAETDTVFAELAQVVRYRLLSLFVVAISVVSVACGVWATQLDLQNDPYLESESWLAICRIASCFAFIMPRLLFLFTDAWGTARVSALVEWHAGTVQGPAKGGNPDPSRVPWRTIVHELVDSFSQVGCGRNLLHTLNSVTVLAFCDKEGLVTDTCRSVRELAIMQPPEPPRQQQDKNSGDRVLTPIVLDIQVDPRQQSGFRFEEASWAHYISSLKPLALAMAVSRQPLHKNKDLTRQTLQISDAMKMLAGGLEVLQDCLCGVARLIGLRDSVAKSFKLIRLFVHVSRTAQQKGEKVCFAKGIMQWFLRDARDQSVQMFCKAPGHEVIDRCSHYFAGNQIHVLTKRDKKALANLMLQWGSSGSFAVGYSYRPVVDYEKYRDFLETGQAQRGGKHIEQLIMEEHALDPDSAMGGFFHNYNNNHILLGLAALKISASVVVPRYLAKVQEAGIRFCLFSPLGDKKTRTTGALLGLETGWNCLIALEPKPEEKVRKNLMGQVVLPSGIPEIRKHLETVDNVPLLVSLFSRASPHTTREMVEILQENGECVVLLGSALKPENFELFYQADSSVSVLVGAAPLCDHCAGLLEPLEADRPADTYVPREIQLSADLTSLPCALQASHSFHDGEQRTICVLVHAIKEARRSVDSIFLVLVFFSCSIMIIALMLILKALLSLPAIIPGVHLALVATLKLPVLSLCLLWNRAHDGIMKEFPFKKADEKMHAQPDHMLALYSIRSLPTAVMLIALFLIYLDQCWVSALQEFTEANGKVSACIGFTFSWWFTGRWVACWLGWQSRVHSLSEADTLEDGPAAVLPSAQIAFGWLLTVYMIIFSAGFLNRCESIFVVGISSNRLWLFTSVLIFCIHSTIASIQMYGVQMTYRPPAPSTLWFALSGSWCMVVVGLNEWVKYKDRLFHLKSQKHLQVLFSTRLGMWSPK